MVPRTCIRFLLRQMIGPSTIYVKLACLDEKYISGGESCYLINQDIEFQIFQ